MKINGISLLVLGLFFSLTIEASSANAAKNIANGTNSALNPTTSMQRDPFWPVGYQPKWLINEGKTVQDKALDGDESTDWNAAMKQVSIQGVSSRSGNEFIAIINGEIKTVGETISLNYGNLFYTWMVDAITPPSSVKLRRISVQ